MNCTTLGVNIEWGSAEVNQVKTWEESIIQKLLIDLRNLKNI